MTVSHIGIKVGPGKLDMMVEWYLKVLAPLGYRKHYDLRPDQPAVGLGAKYPDFWIRECPEAKERTEDDGLHLAFYADTRQQVREFHAEAMNIGAKDNGAPGLRPHYTSDYYAAYAFDPEGRNLETHCMAPAFISEPQQKNILLTAVVTMIVGGLAYLTNYMGYTGYLSRYL
ncbi:hypothetical protein M408DRAFT_5839 [Serendipita vermifera MAFF 305830]|uniref:VOC domain-containing protein n=1 Tax=Serendipita vermifera MAFF 305830 TaxID=933852 RepID=A0A0C3BP87_SERVB|nr:hypothetical protein M408DRAFT_5839 [Serendipita vermifera MAFF 305830]